MAASSWDPLLPEQTLRTENMRCSTTACQQNDNLSQAPSWRGGVLVVQEDGGGMAGRDMQGTRGKNSL